MNLSESLDAVMHQLRSQEENQQIDITADTGQPRYAAEANVFLAWALQREGLLDTSSKEYAPVFSPNLSAHEHHVKSLYYEPLIKNKAIHYALSRPLEHGDSEQISAFLGRVKEFSRSDWSIDRSGPLPHIEKPFPHNNMMVDQKMRDDQRMFSLFSYIMQQRMESEFPEDHSMHLIKYNYLTDTGLDHEALKTNPWCHFANNNPITIQNDEGPAFVYRVTGKDLSRQIVQE